MRKKYMKYNLERFIEAQDGVYDTVKSEILSGKKKTHWMWFIFPQIVGLGESDTSNYYAIKSYDEALEYLKHEILGERLIEITSILLTLDKSDPEKIFGSIDSLKLKSSMTLFYLVSNNSIFSKVIDKFYDGEMDEKTIEILNQLSGNKKLRNLKN